MRSVTRIKPILVKYIPAHADMKEGELYISQEYATAAHLCCCGCRQEVVTPLNPAKWRISLRNGVATVRPSIGNWGYPCKSHYFISNNQVVWAGAYSEQEIQLVQDHDKKAVEHLVRKKQTQHQPVGLLDTFVRWIKSTFERFFG